MLQAKKPDDFVISTGRTESIKKFVDLTCEKLEFKTKWTGEGLNTQCINLDNGKPILQIKKEFFRPSEVDLLIGDSSKARVILDWIPNTSLEELCEEMISFDLKN